MEKIMNMQAQTSTSAAPAILRQAQSSVQETKDDFVRLLQQKDSAGQPEEPRDTSKNKSVKAEKNPDEKQMEEPAEDQADEADLKGEVSDLVQLGLQQSILQQAVVQIADPEIMEQPVMTDAGSEMADIVIPETMQEADVLPPEASVLPEQPKSESVKPEVRTEPVKTAAEPVKTEAKADPVKPELQEQMTEIPGEGQQRVSVTERSPQDVQTAVSEKQDKAEDPEELFQSLQDGLTGQDTNPAASMQNAAPVQAERPQEAPQAYFQEGEHTVKSTVEDLPQELGKAVTAGRPGDSQVLTVELEPASLGKLTIRLEYEAGRTMVSVMASNPKTLELLNEKASEIASILKEHTGEETVIYTEQPQKEPGEEAQEQGSRGGQQQERQQHRQEEPQADSFMQQLRLGLV